MFLGIILRRDLSNIYETFRDKIASLFFPSRLQFAQKPDKIV
jgi:hypothetical protein